MLMGRSPESERNVQDPEDGWSDCLLVALVILSRAFLESLTEETDLG